MRHQTILPAIPQDHRSLERYLSELKKIELITAEEEIRLARQIHGRGSETLANGEIAFNQLVCANLRFVVSVAKQYQHFGLPLMDLISEGNMGLMEAARRFDETKGFKFISYAVWWIRKSILEALSEQGRLIRLPTKQVVLWRRLQDLRAALEQELEREPTLEELAAASQECRLEEVQVLEQAGMRPQSLYAALELEDGRSYLDLIMQRAIPQPDEGVLEVENRQMEVARLLAPLKPRERRVLRLCFGLGDGEVEEKFGAGGVGQGVSFEEIGRQLGLSAERVRRLRHRALLKLRVARNLS